MKKITHASGKRKKAIARATISEGNGTVRINSLLLDVYEPAFAKARIQEPLTIAGDISKKVNIKVVVQGGGFQSQAEAVRLAIAKGLVEFTSDKKLKQTFLDYDRHLLIADVRRNEPSKPNISKPRAKRQKSYR
tara:strand:- start:1778 stop:2179 length:402 start_codon:yes stop_codon:yes gene_type:complete